MKIVARCVLTVYYNLTMIIDSGLRFWATQYTS